ncbi:MAG: ROK family protein [Fibrobacterota bacterium]
MFDLDDVDSKSVKTFASKINKHNILGAIRLNPGTTRQKLSAKLSLSPSLINIYINELIRDHWINVTERSGNTVGRKTESLAVSPHQTLFICILVKPDGIVAHLNNLQGTTLRFFEYAWPIPENQPDYLHSLSQSLNTLSKETDLQTNEMAGVVVFDGPVINPHFHVLQIRGLKEWVPLSLKNLLQRALPFQIMVLSQSHAIINFYRYQQRLTDFIYLDLTGPMAIGVVQCNVITQGHIGTAGELSHASLDPQGLPCICSGTGCLETLDSPAQRWEMLNDRLLSRLVRKYHPLDLLVNLGPGPEGVSFPNRGGLGIRPVLPEGADILAGAYHSVVQAFIQAKI